MRILEVAAFAAATVRGDFAIGGGTGGEAWDDWSTGDWKSEKSSSSSKRFDANGIAVGDFQLCPCEGARNIGVEKDDFEKVGAIGVSSSKELD